MRTLAREGGAMATDDGRLQLCLVFTHEEVWGKGALRHEEERDGCWPRKRGWRREEGRRGVWCRRGAVVASVALLSVGCKGSGNNDV